MSSRPACRFFGDCVSGLKPEGIGIERLELIAIAEELLTASSGKVKREGEGACRIGPLGSAAGGLGEALVSAEVGGSGRGAGTVLTGCSTVADCWTLATGAVVVGGAGAAVAGSLFCFGSSMFAAGFGGGGDSTMFWTRMVPVSPSNLPVTRTSFPTSFAAFSWSSKWYQTSLSSSLKI